MYERILNKNIEPTIEQFLTHIGITKSLFTNIDTFLIEELHTDKKLGFSAHDQCWGMGYHIKRKFVCGINAEKDAFTIITRLSEEKINDLYVNVSPYTKDCIDKSPYRHRGWIEYRVLDINHIKDAKLILRIRAN